MIAGALSGVASGVALGAISGPIGVVLGMWIGVGVGFVTGCVLAHDDQARSARTRELDAIIGITNGSMGRGAVTAPSHAPDEHDDDPPPYSTREAWISEWLTPPPPAVG